MTFNVVISGIGGQGVLTLSEIIAQSAFAAGYDVRTAELHGLSLRFGPLAAHVRFGKKISSPLIPVGSADLILGLERLESLRALEFAGDKTIVMFDTRAAVPTLMSIKKQKYPLEKEAEKKIAKAAKKAIHVPATKIVKAAGFDPISANIYLLGRAIRQKILPLKKNDVLKGMAIVVPPHLLEMNKKVFELGLKK